MTTTKLQTETIITNFVQCFVNSEHQIQLQLILNSMMSTTRENIYTHCSAYIPME